MIKATNLHCVILQFDLLPLSSLKMPLLALSSLNGHFSRVLGASKPK